jgi:hypothetical protein
MGNTMEEIEGLRVPDAFATLHVGTSLPRLEERTIEKGDSP